MQKDDATWLNAAYIVFGVCVAFVIWKALQTTAIQMGWYERIDTWFPFASTGVSAIVGIGATWYLRSVAERHDYFLASIGELRKVTWPSADDTKRMTLIVVVVVALFSAFLTAFDWICAALLKTVIS